MHNDLKMSVCGILLLLYDGILIKQAEMGFFIFLLYKSFIWSSELGCFRFPPDLSVWDCRPRAWRSSSYIWILVLCFVLLRSADPSSAGPSEGLTSVCLFLAALEENLAGFSRCSLSWSSQINQIYWAGHMFRQRDPAHPDPRSASSEHLRSAQD